MAAQYAYVMKNMTKTFPGAQKPVLKDINLQFYQGAKIGIVGPNGAGRGKPRGAADPRRKFDFRNSASSGIMRSEDGWESFEWVDHGA